MNPPDVAVAVDLSVWELFKNAHLVVKLVMIGLLAASVWCWAIILEKFFLFAKTRKETDKFEQVFWSGQSLEELYQALSQRRNTGMAALFVAAMREWKRSIERNPKPTPGTQLRVEKVMDVTISREIERLERRLTFLATVGSTAPFVGLFGTVWGIMTSFQAIAGQQEHQPRGGRARYRRGSVRHRARPGSPPSLRSFSITNSTAKLLARARGWKASPMSSRPSCRVRSM